MGTSASTARPAAYPAAQPRASETASYPGGRRSRLPRQSQVPIRTSRQPIVVCPACERLHDASDPAELPERCSCGMALPSGGPVPVPGGQQPCAVCSNCRQLVLFPLSADGTMHPVYRCPCGTALYNPHVERPQERAQQHAEDCGGAAPGLLAALPTYAFAASALSGARPASDDEEDDDKWGCKICLGDYEDGETLKSLPCFHRFHAECVDKWLGGSRACPLCNTPVDGLQAAEAALLH